MPKKKTHEEFIEEYSKLNMPVEILGSYTGSKNKILCMCKICGQTFETTPSYLLMGRIHKPCAIRQARGKTDVQFKREFDNEDIIIDGTYTGALNPIDVHCRICEYKWSPIASSILHGHGCPVCKKTYHYTTEEFIEKVNTCPDGEDYKVLSKYTKSSNKILFLHKKCNNSFKMIANNFLRGQRCPFCNESKGEQKIRQLLYNNNIDYIPQQNYDNLLGVNNGLLSYDFYLPQYNLLIEYQGEFHDGKARIQSKKKYQIQQEHDMRKRKYAKKHNIQLLEIWYWDYENIEEILKKELNL